AHKKEKAERIPPPTPAEPLKKHTTRADAKNTRAAEINIHTPAQLSEQPSNSSTSDAVPCQGPRLRTANSRLKEKLGPNLLVSLKGLVKRVSKKEPEKLKSTGVGYCSASKLLSVPDWLLNRRDKKAVAARHLLNRTPPPLSL
ncbi:hypothetical protein RRG08_059549, partial [Elysia crispata]